MRKTRSEVCVCLDIALFTCTLPQVSVAESLKNFYVTLKPLLVGYELC